MFSAQEGVHPFQHAPPVAASLIIDDRPHKFWWQGFACRNGGWGGPGSDAYVYCSNNAFLSCQVQVGYLRLELCGCSPLEQQEFFLTTDNPSCIISLEWEYQLVIEAPDNLPSNCEWPFCTQILVHSQALECPWLSEVASNFSIIIHARSQLYRGSIGTDRKVRYHE